MRDWFAQKTHISWHIAAASIGVLAGASLAVVAPYEVFAGWEWLLTALPLFAVAAAKRARWALGLAVAAGLCAGLWLGALKQQELAQYEPYIDQTITLQGKITEDTTFGPEGDQRMRLGSVQVNGRAVGGKIWASRAHRPNLNAAML